MTRLIDADALRERMYHDAFETDSDMQKWDSGCWIRYKMFENALEEAPTVDPEPRHGRWINHISEDGATDGIYCSICDYEVDRFARYNYCPNCGAKMDEDAVAK